MTIRLDPSTRRRLTSVAKRRGRTASAVARDALEAWLVSEEGSAGAGPYEVVADLVGCVRGGDPGRSARGGRAIAAALRARRSRR